MLHFAKINEGIAVKLQATIAGYAGNPATLVGMFDDETGVLVVAKQIKYRETRAGDDFVLVSNLELPSVDVRFGDADLKEAIQCYFTMRSQGVLDIVDELQRYQPDNRIESDAIDAQGRKYRISSEIDNGQLAVLALVCALNAQRPIRSAMSAADELADFYSVQTI